MPKLPPLALNPRKLPVQARSNASVEAILDATIQVLLAVGKERLTTTKVALRAGVSIGTLYQYFPNKSALLQAVLKRHLEEITAEVERVCREQQSNTLRQMATALVSEFLAAKMRDPNTSVALYFVSSDVDGAELARQMGIRTNEAVVAMLASAREPLMKDPRVVAATLQGALAGVSRRLVESSAPERELASYRQELIEMACAYLGTCSEPSPSQLPVQREFSTRENAASKASVQTGVSEAGLFS